MPRPLATPDHLFDRTWRPGHPFRPRLSARRRLIMSLLFLFLCAIIGGYWVATDSRRVRAMAEVYLSDLVGGRVEVGEASVSIFQGLRLEDVTVFVSEHDTQDSILFTAKTFLIKYSPTTLLSGRLEATQIVALDPHVRLTEDLDSGRWNYQQLRRLPSTDDAPGPAGLEDMVLPEILLRNAQVEYSQLRGGEHRSLGSMSIEGQLLPIQGLDRYRFQLQSRGAYEGLGPEVSGDFDLASGQLNAQLHRFEFGRDIKAMLPAQVRQWWEDHALAGRVDVPLLSYRPIEGGENEFTVEIEVNGVTLSVHPDEWTSTDEVFHRAAAADGFEMLRVAGLNGGGFVDHLADMIRPVPIQLQKVNGTFVFTQDGIEVRGLEGYLEQNALKIEGTIGGYTREASVSMLIRSLEPEHIRIPATPRYVKSFPPQMRVIYDHLRPQGTCSFWVKLDRPTPDRRPDVSGEVTILDGNFIFDRFPYPIRGATGTIRFGPDSFSGRDKLEIDLRGRGVAEGPNRNATIHLSGLIEPIGSDPGVNIRIQSNDITSEPTLFAAFPMQTQQALRIFDAPGEGEYPKFSGDFVCDVVRPMGPATKWKVTTEVTLDDAEGALVVFPYPLKGVSGRLRVLEDHVEIINARMKRGDGMLEIDGRVDWGRDHDGDGDPDGGATLRPELNIIARNIPIDRDLLDALPAEHRTWLEKIGAAGRFDLDGKVSHDPALVAESGEAGAGIGFDFRINVREGTLWPGEGTFAASGVTGMVRLQPRRMVIEGLRGRRGDAELAAHGTIEWPEGAAKIDLVAEAKDLALDAALYQVLPENARRGWDQVQPQGTVDAHLTYRGESDEAHALSQGHESTPDFELRVVPRALSITPQALPYRLDDVTGDVTITPGKVQLAEMTARHGEASIRISGAGSTERDGKWDLKLSATNLAVDEELRKALPGTLASLLESSQFAGKINVDFSKLTLLPSEVTADAVASADPTALPTTAPATQPTGDIDFAVRIASEDASLTVAVPMEKLSGVTELQGSTRGGKLAQLNGLINLPSLTIAGRPATNFRATISKRLESDAMQLSKIQAQLAGGELAGQVDWISPDQGPARYAIGLVARNIDVQQLTGEGEHQLRAQLSASLSVEGAWDDPTSRRGRGDVLVTGEEMYRIPVILGLLQITNLALPITSPFREGTCRYSVDGERVTFETIELRSREMLMQGHGHLDFASKQVRMTFVTNNRNWPRLPIIGDLLEGARKELLQIHVRGKLEEPKITAGSLRTFTTTIDEVLRGDGGN